MDLHQYNIIIINSSAGKDSLTSIQAICEMAEKQNYPKDNIVISHQELVDVEWGGTLELAKKQAEIFNLGFETTKQRNREKEEQTLLEYVQKRGKWPDGNNRYCTSDFKRGPGARVVTALTKDLDNSKVLYVFGYRKEESPSRSKKKRISKNTRLTTKRREVVEYLPIHAHSTKKVWDIINHNNLPYHPAYDLGMPRFSCVFCIYSPFDALVLAGMHNRDLLDKYIEVEENIGHTFKNGFSISGVLEAIESGYEPKKINNWIM